MDDGGKRERNEKPIEARLEENNTTEKEIRGPRARERPLFSSNRPKIPQQEAEAATGT